MCKVPSLEKADCHLQVALPADSVLLAYDLIHTEEASDCTIAHVDSAHDSDGSLMMAVLFSNGHLSLYAIEVATGSVSRKSGGIDNIEAFTVVDLCAPQFTGGLAGLVPPPCALHCAPSKSAKSLNTAE